ncbi:MAG TPA: hypothetical protein VD905_01655 [Flavobacteriales bacterium]|nr:hypothetical protein [Flavobacteriales bacterium]
MVANAQKTREKTDDAKKEDKPKEDKDLSTLWNDNFSECEYSGWAVHSVFNLPVLRFNINSFTGSVKDIGTLEYFNSLGAGIAFSFGKINVKSENGSPLEQSFDRNKTITMKNIYGASLGVLFSKSDSIGGSRIIIAPNLNFQALDFQIGAGYELGTVTNTAHRWFFTLSYGIPLSKFANTGSYLLTNPTKDDKKINLKGIF